MQAEDLIPQPHGGALRPFTSGTGAAARRSSIRAVRKEALALLAEATPEATRQLLGLMQSEDERVRTIACSQVLDRVLGKPGNDSQAGDDESGKLDLTHLTAEQRGELQEALNTIYRLTGRNPLDDAATSNGIGTIRRIIVDPKSRDANIGDFGQIVTYCLPDNGC